MAAIVDAHAAGRRSVEATIAAIFTALPAVQARLNPFTEWFEDAAMEAARAADQRLAGGEAPGALHGVPIAIKDMTPSAGHRTTRGSWTTGEGRTQHDAIIVERLKRAGAIVIGKTTTAELAYSSFTNTPRYGITRNPWDPSRTSGGSSGGSAVAVATGLVPLAEGTDMGGSVRIPAAACGVVGFKPSLGRIPMDIMPPALETYSHFGPLAATVDDAVRFVAATAGAHPTDMLSHRPAFDAAAAAPGDLAGRRIALSVDLGYCAVDAEVEQGLRHTAERLARHGALVEEVQLPWTREVFDQWAVRWNCLLALFAGTESAEDTARMDPALVACIERGRRTSAMELLGVDVLRQRLNADLAALFRDHDALICPTNAVPAPSAEASDADFEATLPDGRLQAFDMAHPFNMVPSCPALSLPIGRTGAGLPIGMQIVGPPFADEAALALAGAVEALVEPLPLPPSH
ncbi:MAG: amidase [Pseudomonadota bacterium]